MAKAKETLNALFTVLTHFMLNNNHIQSALNAAHRMNTNLTICLHVSAADTPLTALMSTRASACAERQFVGIRIQLIRTVCSTLISERVVEPESESKTSKHGQINK